jgi:hypothetical protein
MRDHALAERCKLDVPFANIRLLILQHQLGPPSRQRSYKPSFSVDKRKLRNHNAAHHKRAHITRQFTSSRSSWFSSSVQPVCLPDRGTKHILIHSRLRLSPDLETSLQTCRSTWSRLLLSTFWHWRPYSDGICTSITDSFSIPDRSVPTVHME